MSEWDPTEAAPGDGQSSDQSKSGVRQAWEQFSAKPENNAALLQFGLAMLQPRAPGQSGIGQFANAVGQGAEASQRNVAIQEGQNEAEFTRGIKGREAGARETTAQAYADQVKQGAGGKGGLNGTLKVQADFRKWLAKPEDNTGLSSDPIVSAIGKQFPDVKSKADLLGNPQALRAAQQLFGAQVATPEGDDGEAGTPSPVAPAAPASPSGGKIVYDKAGKAYRWDGVQGHPPVPMQ